MVLTTVDRETLLSTRDVTSWARTVHTANAHARGFSGSVLNGATAVQGAETVSTLLQWRRLKFTISANSSLSQKYSVVCSVSSAETNFYFINYLISIFFLS